MVTHPQKVNSLFVSAPQRQLNVCCRVATNLLDGVNLLSLTSNFKRRFSIPETTAFGQKIAKASISWFCTHGRGFYQLVLYTLQTPWDAPQQQEDLRHCKQMAGVAVADFYRIKED
jgi:hypothetical protein